jgi:hypothetical protein
MPGPVAQALRGACCRNRAPAFVTLTPVRCRSNSDTPRSSSSARTWRLTADCLIPNTRAAALKLKYWATTRACLMATGLIIADFAMVRDDDLCCDMSCSSTRTTAANDRCGSAVLGAMGRIQIDGSSTFRSLTLVSVNSRCLSLTLANSEQAYRPCGMRNMGSLSTIS